MFNRRTTCWKWGCETAELLSFAEFRWVLLCCTRLLLVCHIPTLDTSVCIQWRNDTVFLVHRFMKQRAFQHFPFWLNAGTEPSCDPWFNGVALRKKCVWECAPCHSRLSILKRGADCVIIVRIIASQSGKIDRSWDADHLRHREVFAQQSVVNGRWARWVWNCEREGYLWNSSAEHSLSVSVRRLWLCLPRSLTFIHPFVCRTQLAPHSILFLPNWFLVFPCTLAHSVTQPLFSSYYNDIPSLGSFSTTNISRAVPSISLWCEELQSALDTRNLRICDRLRLITWHTNHCNYRCTLCICTMRWIWCVYDEELLQRCSRCVSVSVSNPGCSCASLFRCVRLQVPTTRQSTKQNKRKSNQISRPQNCCQHRFSNDDRRGCRFVHCKVTSTNSVSSDKVAKSSQLQPISRTCLFVVKPSILCCCVFVCFKNTKCWCICTFFIWIKTETWVENGHERFNSLMYMHSWICTKLISLWMTLSRQQLLTTNLTHDASNFFGNCRKRVIHVCSLDKHHFAALWEIF